MSKVLPPHGELMVSDHWACVQSISALALTQVSLTNIKAVWI